MTRRKSHKSHVSKKRKRQNSSVQAHHESKEKKQKILEEVLEGKDEINILEEQQLDKEGLNNVALMKSSEISSSTASLDASAHSMSTYLQIMGSTSQPTFKLTKSAPLSSSRLPELFLYVLGSERGALLPSWCDVEYRGCIQQVVCLYLHGVSSEMWNSLRMSPSRTFGQAFSPFLMTELKTPWDQEPFWMRRHKRRSDLQKNGASRDKFKLIAKDRMSIIQWDNKMLRSLFYVKKEKPLKQRKDYSTMGSTMQALRDASAESGTSVGDKKAIPSEESHPKGSDAESNTSTTKSGCTIEQLLLTKYQLKDNLYPNHDEHPTYISLPTGESKYSMVAIDCEMCETSEGKELTRVTFVDSEHNVIYDELVKPHNEIIDYYTVFSGITEEKLENVTHSLKDVHEYIISTFTSETVFVGHSLENDLKALKLVHDRVIDTALVFPHQNSLHKHSLKNLCKRWLNREIQTAGNLGHDSAEDARAAMELTLKKLENGLTFGKIQVKQENFIKQVAKDKTLGLVDDHHALRHILNGAASAMPCTTDEDTIKKAVHSIKKRRANFTWVHFHSVEQWFERNAKNLVGGKGHDAEDTKPLPHDVEKRLGHYTQSIFDSCPENTLVCVIGTPEMHTLQQLSEKFVQMGGREDDDDQDASEEDSSETEIDQLKERIRNLTNTVKNGAFAHFCLKGASVGDGEP